jgi:hypothetical protein
MSKFREPATVYPVIARLVCVPPGICKLQEFYLGFYLHRSRLSALATRDMIYSTPNTRSFIPPKASKVEPYLYSSRLL